MAHRLKNACSSWDVVYYANTWLTQGMPRPTTCTRQSLPKYLGGTTWRHRSFGQPCLRQGRSKKTWDSQIAAPGNGTGAGRDASLASTSKQAQPPATPQRPGVQN